MFNLLKFINLRVNKYKYYYNTKLSDINLLDPINLYLVYNRFIKYSLLKLPKQIINYIIVKPYNYLNRIYIKISIVVIGRVISALLYARIKSYTWVIYLTNKRRQFLVNVSEPSDSNKTSTLVSEVLKIFKNSYIQSFITSRGKS